MSSVDGDLAWLGEYAAARLPREVRLRAEGPLAATAEAEIARLRAMSSGAAGSLHLWDPQAAAQEVPEADGPLALGNDTRRVRTPSAYAPRRMFCCQSRSRNGPFAPTPFVTGTNSSTNRIRRSARSVGKSDRSSSSAVIRAFGPALMALIYYRP